MSTIKRWLWFVVPLVLLGGLVVWRINTRNQEQAAQGPGAARGPGGGAAGPGGPGGGGGRGGPPAVQVADAAPATIETTIELVGNIESPFRVQLSPKTSGRIDYLQVREGDEVQPGQVLLRIDPTEIQAQVLQQQSAVAEARSRLAQAQLGQGPNTVSVSSQIEQQRAMLTSAKANETQITRNYESQVAAAQAAVADADAKVNGSQAQVANNQAAVNREQADLANVTARFQRIDSLYKQGFVAAQDVDDARTAMQVQANEVQVAQAQLSAARQAVTSAQAQRTSANQQLAIAKRKGLSDIAAAKAQTAQAQASLKVANANRANNPAYRENLAALQASVQAAEAQLGQARSRLADTSIRSTIRGIVTARTSDVGSIASPGSPVLTIQFLDWVYVTSSLPIESSGQVRVGQPVQIRFDAIPDRVFRGAISNINPAADEQSRQFGIRVKLPNPKHELRPGMFGHVGIVTSKVDAPVAVPKEAVRTNREGTTVTVVNADSKAEVRTVKTGATDDRLVQILSGVDAGDKVVILSYQPLREGQQVRVPGQGGGPGGRGGQGQEGRRRAAGGQGGPRS